MKANLVENLILAHCSGDEQKFSNALQRLTDDETKKGNVATATRLRKAYEQAPPFLSNASKTSSNNLSASSLSPSVATPRDKDSLLELYNIFHPNVLLDDVVLPDNQKNIIKQFIEEQTHAETLLQHNIPPANRILLCGPPGCGKTMTAHAICSTLHLPMAYVRLDGLVSSYLGQTSTNLRKVFDAVKTQRIVLFLDEFDAIAKKRDDTNELGELKRVVTTLLQNFDNLPPNVILLAATNHEHLLDPAIWRRFNFTISIGLPTLEQRKQLIQKSINRYQIDSDIKIPILAKITEGMSGARIEELMRESAKKHLINGQIKTSDITGLLIQQKTQFSNKSTDAMKEICELLDHGISLRNVAASLGISHSTLEYRVDKYRSENT